LKIDRSFIREVAASRDDAEIVRAIVSLAHSLHLKVIAEGVETDEQLTFLRGLGCDQYQGFHCSPPVPADEFEKMMSTVARDIAFSGPQDNTTDTIMIRALRKA
jgi:diguanylate cyclase